jgi:hypothetical protein
MNNLSKDFELLLGHAAFKLWPDLPRDMQEKLFEAAVPDNPLLRYSFAVFLHDHHPRTAPSAGPMHRIRCRGRDRLAPGQAPFREDIRSFAGIRAVLSPTFSIECP